jgi:type I restriction enzyme, S subunit
MAKDISLPDGWNFAKLNEICDVVSGGTPKGINSVSGNGDIPWYRVSDMNSEGNEELLINSHVCLTYEEAKLLKIRIMPSGTVVFPKRGGAIATNKKRIFSKPSGCDLNIMGIIPKDVSQRYFWHWFNTIDLSKLSDGSNVPQINHGDIEPLIIPLPLLSDQARIVAKIEELFTQLDAGVAGLRRVQAALKRYKASVLKAACEGRLVEQDPSDEPAEEVLKRLGKLPLVQEYLPSLPRGWCWTTTGALCNCIVPNRDKPKSFTGDIPWITFPDLGESVEIRESKSGLGLSREEIQMYKARIIPKGSVIMSCIGRFGITAVVSKELVVNQQFHAFIVEEDTLHARYLAYAIRTQTPFMEQIATATTIAYLNKANCNSIPIPLPPRSEQSRIVAEVERRLSVLQEMEQTVEASLKRAGRLRQAILKRAFEGRLV